MSPRPICLVFAAVACTPHTEPTGATDELVATEHGVAPEPGADPVAMPLFGCAQRFPSPDAGIALPWTYDARSSEVDCVLGCLVTVEQNVQTYGGVDVELARNGAVEIAAALDGRTWSRTLTPSGFYPTHVRWANWCTDQVVLAIHDGAHLRRVALDQRSGAVLFDDRVTMGRRPDTSLDVQMFCHGDATTLHVKGQGVGWVEWISGSTPPVITRRTTPTPVLAWLDHGRRPGRPDRGRDVHVIHGETFAQLDGELWVLDRRGRERWRRRSVGTHPGCTDGFDLEGGSRRIEQYFALALIDDGFVAIFKHDVFSDIDVFDFDGHHIAHIAE